MTKRQKPIKMMQLAKATRSIDFPGTARSLLADLANLFEDPKAGTVDDCEIDLIAVLDVLRLRYCERKLKGCSLRRPTLALDDESTPIAILVKRYIVNLSRVVDDLVAATGQQKGGKHDAAVAESHIYRLFLYLTFGHR